MEDITDLFVAIIDESPRLDLAEAEFKRRVASYGGMMKHTDNATLKQRMNEIYLQEREKAMKHE